MPRLPKPGGDEGRWGEILNEYLLQAHRPSGALKPGAVSETSLTTALKDKIEQGVGATGASGASGAPGAAGSSGPPGPAGSTGVMGPAGATGSAGATGASGSPGTPGAQGATGPAGQDGTDGTDGQDGATGATGATGGQGPVGATGPEGPPGPASTQGATGATGAQGEPGATGAGTAGNDGADGQDGATGATGAQGATGPKGDDGDSGTPGSQGATGTMGATGPAGSDGADGDTGATGPQGATGAAGTQGATGPAGDPLSLPDGSIPQAKVEDLTTDLADLQTELDGKADSSHTHSGYLVEKNNIAGLTDSTADQFLRVNITDDASPTAGWPDRLEFRFSGTRTGYFNEYGELRARPAKVNTVALRAMQWSGASTTDIFQVANSTSSVLYFGVGPNTITVGRPISSDSNITTTGTVSAANIGNKVTTSNTAPPSPAVGDVWIDTST